MKEELEITIKEKDGLQTDLKKLTDEIGTLVKLRDDMTTEICDIQACLYSLYIFVSKEDAQKCVILALQSI